MVPKTLLSAELTGTVPTSTTLVFSLMQMPIQVNQEMLTKYGLSPEAAAAASAFIKTGSVVTTDGEMNPSEAPVASPANAILNQVTETLDLTTEIRKRSKAAFPNLVTPTVEEAEQIAELADYNLELFDAVLVNMLNFKGKTPVNNVPRLAVWMLTNRQHDWLLEQAEIMSRQASTNPDKVVARVLRKAEAQMGTLTKPVANRKTVDKLNALLEELDG
jgi:hypothetical protein